MASQGIVPAGKPKPVCESLLRTGTCIWGGYCWACQTSGDGEKDSSIGNQGMSELEPNAGARLAANIDSLDFEMSAIASLSAHHALEAGAMKRKSSNDYVFSLADENPVAKIIAANEAAAAAAAHTAGVGETHNATTSMDDWMQPPPGTSGTIRLKPPDAAEEQEMACDPASSSAAWQNSWAPKGKGKGNGKGFGIDDWSGKGYGKGKWSQDAFALMTQTFMAMSSLMTGWDHEQVDGWITKKWHDNGWKDWSDFQGRPGDWECPQCFDYVWASKSKCYKCGAPKPAIIKEVGKPFVDSPKLDLPKPSMSNVELAKLAYVSGLKQKFQERQEETKRMLEMKKVQEANLNQTDEPPTSTDLEPNQAADPMLAQALPQALPQVLPEPVVAEAENAVAVSSSSTQQETTQQETTQLEKAEDTVAVSSSTQPETTQPEKVPRTEEASEGSALADFLGWVAQAENAVAVSSSTQPETTQPEKVLQTAAPSEASALAAFLGWAGPSEVAQAENEVAVSSTQPETTQPEQVVQAEDAAAVSSSTQPEAELQIAATSEGKVKLNALGLPSRPGESACKSFLENGACKFGVNCRHDHPMAADRAEPKEVVLNSRGMSLRPDDNNLPVRPGKEPCPFLMKAGACHFGPECRFDHSVKKGDEVAITGAASSQEHKTPSSKKRKAAGLGGTKSKRPPETSIKWRA